VQYRKGEIQKTYFRMQRFFAIGNEWFASTREGSNLGPFKNREAAEQGLLRYIIDVKNNRKPGFYGTKPVPDVWKSGGYK
jgi:hypothetical protein